MHIMQQQHSVAFCWNVAHCSSCPHHSESEPHWCGGAGSLLLLNHRHGSLCSLCCHWLTLAVCVTMEGTAAASDCHRGAGGNNCPTFPLLWCGNTLP